MSWISTLCETYDNNIDKAGTYDGQTYPLSVNSHILANARLEITIDDDGNFIEAKELEKIKKDKNDKTNDLSGVTIIPVTEDSGGGRSSGIVPHPLCDTLSYIAGDYAAYVSGKKDKEKALEKSEKYLENLKKWAESDYSHYKVRAVYKYLEKKTVIADLVRENVVELDSHGMISSKKICGETAERAMARFIIRSPEHDETEKCWEDKTLFRKFSEYYNSVISSVNNHDIWHTWSVLEKKLIPYYKQTDLASVEYYKSLIGCIIEQLQTDSPAKLNMPLRETYLLGYYHQRKEMFTKKEEDK